jgi:chromosome segregation ATPase
MLQHVHDQAEDMGQASALQAQLRDLRDDMELKDALIQSVKESESRANQELAFLKEKFARMEGDFAEEKERTASLEFEKSKLKAEEDGSALKLLQSELLGAASKLHKTQVELRETQEKLEEAYRDMDTTVDDSYRDCVKTFLFLNLGIELNTRGL